MYKEVYITRDALTTNLIFKTNAEIKPVDDNGAILYAWVPGHKGFDVFRIGKDAFYTIEEARKNVEEKRMKEINRIKELVIYEKDI